MGEWLEVWIRGFIEDDSFNGRLINSNSFVVQPGEKHIGKAVRLHRYDPRSSSAGDAISLLLVKQCFWKWFIGRGYQKAMEVVIIG